MKRLFCALVFTICLAGMLQSHAVGNRPRVIAIHRPTIVAFFLPLTESEANSGEGDAEALDDFNYYACKVQGRLKKAGIQVLQVNGRSFQIRDGAKTRTFRIGETGVGYYFIAPGREPHVEIGVMTDDDLVLVAQRYFGVPIPRQACTGPHCSK